MPRRAFRNLLRYLTCLHEFSLKFLFDMFIAADYKYLPLNIRQVFLQKVSQHKWQLFRCFRQASFRRISFDRRRAFRCNTHTYYDYSFFSEQFRIPFDFHRIAANSISKDNNNFFKYSFLYFFPGFWTNTGMYGFQRCIVGPETREKIKE